MKPTDPTAQLLERAQSLGLLCWRCACDGTVLAVPDASNAPGLWTSAPEITALVTGAIEAWNDQDEPEIAEVFPGCRLIPICETRRRKRKGYIAAMALGPEAFERNEFNDACATVGSDAGVTRQTLAANATYDETSASHVQRMLTYTLADLTRLEERRVTIDGFTQHLTDAYENTELLYRLGRSMNNPARPADFIRDALDELFQTTDFSWLVVRCSEGAKLSPDIAGRWFLRRTDEVDKQSVREVVEAQVDPRADRELIINDLGVHTVTLGPQIVAEPILRDGRLVGHLVAGAKRGDDPQLSTYDTQLLEAVCGYLGTMLENAALFADQQATLIGSLRALTAAIDAKDRYTRGHSERVAYLARELALAVGFDEATAERVHIAGLLHDVGKIGVPEAVLCKPGRLTDEEFDLIKQHPGIGHEILRGIPALEDILPAVLHHHERYDGRGYPNRIAGEEIPLAARIMAVADTFDAMSSNRSYRSAMPREKVLAEIRKCAGTQFCPTLVEPFLALDLAEYDRLVAKHQASEQRRAA